MTRKTYSASQIGNFLLAITDPDDNDMSNLKLQKLCYYAQGLCTAMRGAPLIAEQMEAWDHGPVIPALYHEKKSSRAAPLPIPENFDFAQIDASDRKALTDLYEFYGQYSAWRLRDMTHDEKPWLEAYKSVSKQITLDALVDFFSPQVNDEYKSKIYQ